SSHGPAISTGLGKVGTSALSPCPEKVASSYVPDWSTSIWYLPPLIDLTVTVLGACWSWISGTSARPTPETSTPFRCTETTRSARVSEVWRNTTNTDPHGSSLSGINVLSSRSSYTATSSMRPVSGHQNSGRLPLWRKTARN